MSGSRQIRRVVVVHGPADESTTSVLSSAGLVVVAEVDGTTLWAPTAWQPARPAPDPEPHHRAQRLLTIGEAAALLGVGRSTTYELITTGQLEAVHLGRAARVPLAAVDDLISRLRARPAAHQPAPSQQARSQGTDNLRTLGPPDASRRTAAAQPSAS